MKFTVKHALLMTALTALPLAQTYASGTSGGSTAGASTSGSTGAASGTTTPNANPGTNTGASGTATTSDSAASTGTASRTSTDPAANRAGGPDTSAYTGTSTNPNVNANTTVPNSANTTTGTATSTPVTGTTGTAATSGATGNATATGTAGDGMTGTPPVPSTSAYELNSPAGGTAGAGTPPADYRTLDGTDAVPGSSVGGGATVTDPDAHSGVGTQGQAPSGQAQYDSAPAIPAQDPTMTGTASPQNRSMMDDTMDNAANPGTPFENDSLDATDDLAAGLPETPAASAQTVADVTGLDVVDGSGRKIARISNIVSSDNNQLYAVVKEGGFLGLGARQRVVPLNQMRFNPDRENLTLSGTIDIKGYQRFEKKNYTALPDSEALSLMSARGANTGTNVRGAW